MFKLGSPSKSSPFVAIHLRRHFSHCLQQFLNLSIWMPFSASAIFYFTVSTLTKFPFEDFLHPGKKKKLIEAEIWTIGRVGHGVMPFLVRNG